MRLSEKPLAAFRTLLRNFVTLHIKDDLFHFLCCICVLNLTGLLLFGSHFSSYNEKNYSAYNKYTTDDVEDCGTDATG